jgi:hypothetical protein
MPGKVLALHANPPVVSLKIPTYQFVGERFAIALG